MNHGLLRGTFSKRTRGESAREWHSHSWQSYAQTGTIQTPRSIPAHITLDNTVAYPQIAPAPTSASRLYDGTNGFPAQMQGPSGVVTIDGTTTWRSNAGFAGGNPAMQTMRVDKNPRGIAANLPSTATFNHSPSFLADGATVAFAAGFPLPATDLPGGYSGIATATHYVWGITDDPWFGTANTGTLTDTALNSQGFVSQPIFYGKVTLNARADFVSRELYRATGDGGTPSIAQHIGLFIEPYAAATQNIGILIDDATAGAAPGATDVWGIYNRRAMYTAGSATFAGNIVQNITATNTASRTERAVTSTQTFATTAAMVHTLSQFTGTDTWTVAPNGSFMFIGYKNAGTFTNGSAAAVNLQPVIGFSAAHLKQIDTQTGLNLGGDIDFQSGPVYGVANAGTFTSGTHQGFASGLVMNATGCTLTNHTAIWVAQPTVVAGTVTTAVGVDIQRFVSAGTTNIGFRNAGSTVLTPLVVTVTANAATVPVTCSCAKLTNSSAANMTVTMATAGAQDGQCIDVRIYDATAVTKTITWVNTENGYNGAGNITAPANTLGSTTVPTYGRFMFNSATTKWTCIAV